MRVLGYYMKEIKLSNTDYSIIKEMALKKYLDLSIKSEHTHVSMCYSEALIDYTVSQKLVIKNGKVYKDEET